MAITFARFKQLTVMPSSDADLVESYNAGWIERQCATELERVYAQLAKRYAVPFSDPIPTIVEHWVVRRVTPRAYLQRGVNALDAQFDMVRQDAEDAQNEIESAANATEGLWELPLRSDDSTRGATKPTVVYYSEPSPYEWNDAQRAAVTWR